jgi:hypothetical protein|tara:strand:- start:1545 stop:2165 length:621 start_codon:yes stop_codon:yes gene_type:complete
MASEVGICNAALQLVKNSKQITSLAQGTKEANACEIIYDELRQAVLEMHGWNFAVKRAKLGQLATTTAAFGWDYSYQLPSDFLRALGVHQDSGGRDRIAYKVEGSTISSDASDLYLRYIRDETDPNMMPATFRLCLSKLLASRLAVTLSQSTSLSKEMYIQFVDEDMPTAKAADSIQDFPDQLPESEWVSVRYGDFRNYEPGDSVS